MGSQIFEDGADVSGVTPQPEMNASAGVHEDLISLM